MGALKVPGSSPGQIIIFCWCCGGCGPVIFSLAPRHTFTFALRTHTHFSVCNLKIIPLELNLKQVCDGLIFFLLSWACFVMWWWWDSVRAWSNAMAVRRAGGRVLPHSTWPQHPG